MWVTVEEPRGIGEALDLVDNIGRRSLKDWRDSVGEVRSFVHALEDEKTRASGDQAKHYREILDGIYDGLNEATRSLTRTAEELTTRISVAFSNAC